MKLVEISFKALFIVTSKREDAFLNRSILRLCTNMLSLSPTFIIKNFPWYFCRKRPNPLWRFV